MKKRLVSVLLALTLCGALTVPAFAEQAEEVAIPQETENLLAEENQDIPDLGMENGEFEWTIGHLHCVEEYEIEEPLDGTEGEEMGVTKWQVGYRCSDESCPYLQNSQTIDTLSLSATSGEIPFICRACGDYNWGSEQFLTIEYSDAENTTTHNERIITIYYCQTSGCGGFVTCAEPWRTVTHPWKKGSFAGYQSNAVAHKAMYNYSCVCGATKTEPESSSEPHAMKEVGYTGNNYHQGTKHYFEYEYECTQCGYTKTQYKSYSCPGPQGGGCIMPDTPINRVDPPVEVQDVTEPEETT